MENENSPTNTIAQVAPAEPYQAGVSPEELRQQRRMVISIIAAAIFLLVLIIGGAVFLLNLDGDTTAKIRDVFIIFMALESLIVGLVLVILVIQLARLINLLQNELKPIIESTNETVSTLRGTTQFLSDNIAEPIIKINEYLAGLTELFRIFKPAKSKEKKSS